MDFQSVNCEIIPQRGCKIIFGCLSDVLCFISVYLSTYKIKKIYGLS